MKGTQELVLEINTDRANYMISYRGNCDDFDYTDGNAFKKDIQGQCKHDTRI